MTTHVYTEAEWQATVIELARINRWRVQHSRPSKQGERWLTAITGDVGFPDLVLVHKTRGAMFVELKTDTGRTSDAQKTWEAFIRSAGAEYHLWRPRDIAIVMARLGGEA